MSGDRVKNGSGGDWMTTWISRSPSAEQATGQYHGAGVWAPAPRSFLTGTSADATLANLGRTGKGKRLKSAPIRVLTGRRPRGYRQAVGPSHGEWPSYRQAGEGFCQWLRNVCLYTVRRSRS